VSLIGHLDELKQLVQTQLDHLSSYQRSTLYQLEARHTLFHLQRLLRNRIEHGLTASLVSFLRSRWLYIQHSGIAYCWDVENPANICCIAVAKAMANTDSPWIFMLIPTLERVNKHDYVGSSVFDEIIDLRDVVLSETNTRLLFIPEIIAYAKDSGCYHHSSLFQLKEKLLNRWELSTLRSKHSSIVDCMNAIAEKVKFEQQQETLGYRLQKLIQGLKCGSISNHKNQEVDEWNEGSDADWAMIEFTTYVEMLSPEKQQTLFNASIITNASVITIGTLWNRLNRQEYMDRYAQTALARTQEVAKVKEADLSPLYCVDQIWRELEQIIDTPDNRACLFKTYSYEQADNEEYNELQQEITLSQDIMAAHLRSAPFFERKDTQSVLLQLTKDFVKKIATDRSFMLTSKELDYIYQWKNSVKNNQTHRNFLSNLNRIIERHQRPPEASCSFFKPSKHRRKEDRTSVSHVLNLMHNEELQHKSSSRYY